MSRMTTAELRGYQQICGENGAIMVIACDQRGGIRQILAKTPEERAKISGALLEGSIVGRRASISGLARGLNVGDDAVVGA